MSVLRKWATPLTIASFTIVGVTGVLWYFHLVTGIARWMHEIIGLAMMVIIGLHVVLNWRAFTCYFKRPIALIVIGLGVALTIGAYVWPQEQTQRGGPPNLAVISKFADEDLTTLAPLLDTEPEILVQRLEDGGYENVTQDSSIAALTGSNTRSQLSAFSILVE